MRIFTKRLLAVLLSVIMVIMVVPVSSIIVSAENTTEFLGGEGTEEKPYLISNKTHLNNVRYHLYAHFKMVADIVFTEADFAEDGEFYNYGLGWDPIGIDEDSAFTGVFDGDGYAIIGLYCNQDDDFTRYAGLFGNNRGMICNLGIENGRMSAAFSNDVYAGGIAGYNVGAISNCYNMGDVSARASSSYADAYAGGIAGRNDGTISTCYNTGNVSAYSKYSRVGGITGWNNSAISNCYNIGSVSASFMYSLVGGIAGRNDGVISTCYNIGSVSVSSSSYDVYIGGIAGWNNTTIADCYYLNFLVKGVGSGTDTTTKCSVEEMKQQSTFVGFDFDTGWEFAEGNIYPFPTLQAAPHFEENAEENTTDFLGGTGTPYNPYLISNKTHLNNVRNYLGAHFKMMADIVFTEADFAEDGEFYNDGRGWEPIGTDADSAFAGVFDGNGYVIVGLHCNSDIGSVSGLFGYNQGLICDLGMEDNSSVSSYSSDYAGGIVGYNGGTIDNCYNMGNVSASTYNSIRTGGIVGYNRGNIINCCNAGNIRATSISNIGTGASSYAGGITGWNGGAISNCYNTGDVSALAISTLYDNSASAVGGITGNNGGTINTCYNTGNMSASSDYSDVGGIAGYNGNTISNCYNTGDVLVRYDSNVDMGGIVGNSNGTISNCYNTGNVSAVTSSANAGGIVGYNDGFAGNCYKIGDVSTSSNGDFNVGGIVGYRTKVDSTISNCYYLDNISQGVGIGTDTTTKCTAEQMKQHSTFVGFDFDYVWEIDSYRDYHYPQLKNNRQEPIQSIELLSQSADIQVIEGLWPDSIDATVKITYADGLEITTDVTSQMLSELDISQIGTQTIHFTYGGKVTAETIDIEVIPKSISSIAVTTLPDKTAYVQGQPLNPAGGELTVSYNNNTSEIVDLSEAQLSYPLEQTGIVTATAEYNGFSATFSVTINEKQIQSIGIIEPEKVSYIEGETLDLTGGKLQITYVSEDNYTERIPLAVDMISGYDPNVIGIQTLTVEYEGQKITFVIRVTAKSLTHIAVTARPDKISYLEDKDAFDPTGGQVTLYYNNGTGEIIDLSAEMVSGFDNTQVGKQALTVTYEGFTDTFEVEITAKKLSAIKLTTLPTKLAYTKNYEAFDPTGGQVTLYYNNDTSEVIDLSVEMVSGFDNTQVGKQTLIVIYEGFNDTFEIEILAYLPGDTDGDSKVTIDDVAYLLNHVYFPELYPVSQECDFNGDDTVNIDDVAYLLNHVYFPDIYPLE